MAQVYFQYFYMEALTAGVQVKPNEGQLEVITIGVAGTGGNVLILYDGTSTSDPKIATLDMTVAIGPLPLPVKFFTGLFAALVNGTAAKVTICWS